MRKFDEELKEYSLEEHLKTLCELNPGYEPLLQTWLINKKRFEGILESVNHNFPTFSKHDVSHCITIINCLEKLLGDTRIKQLGATETWFLLHSILLHDWGMALLYEDVEKLLNKNAFNSYLIDLKKSSDVDLRNAANVILNLQDQPIKESNAVYALHIKQYITLLVSDYFRKGHAASSENNVKQNIDKNLGLNYGLIPNRLFTVLSEIISCHTKDFNSIYKLEYQQAGYKNDIFHPRFIASMLRIGDLLDLDNLRFNPSIYNSLFNNLPDTALKHLKKHMSLKNLLITEEKIDIIMDCENSSVYREAKQWLSWLESDLNNLAIGWGRIVPKNFTGYLPFFSSQKVLIKGKDTGDLQLRFSKDNIYKILKGESLYTNSQYVFVRELIQNALDATKIQMHRDIKSGKYPSLNSICDNYTPFDLMCYEDDKDKDRNIFKYYPINITTKYNDKNVYILFKDVGTGIDDKSLKNLTNISSSYKSRDIWESEISKMPRWIRPTGGFGIGLQSSFNVTDRIAILTKSYFSIPAKKIELFSFDDGGFINVEEVDEKTDLIEFDMTFDDLTYFSGTIVLIKIHIDNFKVYENTDRFDDFSNQKLIINSIKNYIEHECFESFFQIHFNNIRLINIEESHVMDIFSQNRFLTYNETKVPYCYCEKEVDPNRENVTNSLCYWDQEKDVLVNFNITNSYHGTLNFKYKGIETNYDYERNEYIGNFFYGVMGPCSLMLDLYGYEVSDVLTINREGIKKSFAVSADEIYIHFAKKSVQLFVNLILEKDYEFKFDLLSLYLLCYKYEIDFSIDLAKITFEWPVNVIDKNGAAIKIDAKQIIADLNNSNGVNCLTTSRGGIVSDNYKDFDGFNKLNGESEYFITGSLAICFEIFCKVSIVKEFKYCNMTNFHTLCNQGKKQYLFKKATEEEFVLQIIKQINKKERVYISAIEEYQELAVITTECGEFDYDFESDFSNYRIYGTIISPVKRNDIENGISKEMLLEKICKQTSFKKIVDFVYENQVYTNKYGRQIIIEKYIELINKIYDNSDLY